MMKSINIFFTVVLVFFLAGTAFAAEWNLYGSARMATFFTSRDLQEQGPDDAGRTQINNTQWALQGNSRIGANVKSDVIEGRFEFGINESDVTARLIYGVWKFSDNWSLKVGKDYTPILFGLSNQVFNNDQNLWQWGNAYGGRVGQIAIEGRGFKLAAISPNSAETVDPTGNVAAVGVENYWPKFEASYRYAFADNMSVHIFGGWQNYKFYALLNDGTTNSGTITSLAIGAGADLNFGPVYVKPQFSWYKNGAAAGWLEGTLQGDASISVSPVIRPDGEVTDIDTIMAMLAIGYSVTERIRLEIGGGYLHSEGKENNNNFYALYLQSVLILAPSVYLVPEIGYIDYGNGIAVTGPNPQLGNQWYVGAKWQINF